MKKAYYREQALERIARDVIIAYDRRLYYGSPAAIPIEDIIEAQGLVLEYQYLRNNGRVLGETIFDDGLTAIYDWENHRYDLLTVKGGTIEPHVNNNWKIVGNNWKAADHQKAVQLLREGKLALNENADARTLPGKAITTAEIAKF